MSFAVCATHTERGIRERALARTSAPAIAAANAQAEWDRKARVVAEKRLAEATQIITGLREMVAKLEEADLVWGSSISGRMVLAEVSRMREIPIHVMTGTSKVRPIAMARQEAMYEVKRRCPWLSLSAIGDLFGGKDHTTVLFAIRNWPAKAAKANINVLPLDRTEGEG